VTSVKRRRHWIERGSPLVSRLVTDPEAAETWAALPLEQQEHLAAWVGRAWSPWERRNRMRLAAMALRLGSESVDVLLHSPPFVPTMGGPGN
jgi:hypothetical protein